MNRHARARSTDPISSHLAAADQDLSGRRTAHCALIAAILRAGHSGKTYRELHAVHEAESTLAGRMPIEAVEFERRLDDLRKDRTVRSDTPRVCTVSGRPAQIWFSLERGVCRVCGKPFAPRSRKHLHCSKACRLLKRPTATAWRIDPTHAGHELYFEGRAARDCGLGIKACPYDVDPLATTEPGLFGAITKSSSRRRRDSRAWYWMAGWKDRQLELEGEFAVRSAKRKADLPSKPGQYLFTWRHDGRRLAVEVVRRGKRLYARELAAKARALAAGDDPGPGLAFERIPAGSIEWKLVMEGAAE